jgi:hypothetical protein
MRCFDLNASDMCARTAQMDSPAGNAAPLASQSLRDELEAEKGGGIAGCVSADAN